MLNALRDGVQYVRDNDLKTIWDAFLHRDAHPLLQFVKYGFCGVLATAVNLGVVLLLGYTIFPAFSEVNGVEISWEVRRVNLIYSNIGGFIVANFVAYFSNLLFVFHGGRHHRVMEFVLFTAVSSIGLIAGLVAGPLQINEPTDKSFTAQIIMIVVAMAVNFVTRKFVIFSR